MPKSGKKTKWKSARKALKTLWGREAVEEMKSRLLGFREELKLHLLVRLKYMPNVFSKLSTLTN